VTSVVDTASNNSKRTAELTATTGRPSVDCRYLCCWN